MTERRRHPRFTTGTSCEGSLRIGRDVSVERGAEKGTVAVLSHVSAMADEVLTLDLVAPAAARSLTVRVIDSRPVVVDGAVRHALRLAVVDRSEPPA